MAVSEGGVLGRDGTIWVGKWYPEKFFWDLFWPIWAACEELPRIFFLLSIAHHSAISDYFVLAQKSPYLG